MKLAVLADASLVHTYRWIDFFVNQGDEILLLSLEDGSSPNGVRFIKLPAKLSFNAFKYPLALPAIKNQLSKFQPQAIIGHFVPNYGLLSSLTSIHPNIICAWGSDILVSAFKSHAHRYKARWILSHADLITADAQYIVDKIQTIMQRTTPVLLEPLGIEPELYPPNHLPKQNLLLSVRNFEPVYDLATLLKALALVKVSNPQLKSIIIGRGTEQEKLIHLAHRLTLDDSIEFRPPVPRIELIQLLNQSKLYVSTATSDGSSVSLLEAMVCGCLPIVTNIPSNREWITDNHNGYLFACGNYQQLADLIIKSFQFPLQSDYQTLNRQIILAKADYYKNMATIRNSILKLVQHG
jgi:L-malate glycosyltransferase